MRVNFITANPKADPLTSSPNIPKRLSNLLLPASERLLFSAQKFEYLEQRYISEDCCYNNLDIFCEEDKVTHPFADEKMVVIVQMWKGSVLCKLDGLDDLFYLLEGNSYIFFLPANACHEARLPKGHIKVAHFFIKLSYLQRISHDYPEIQKIVELFTNEATSGFVGKPAVMDSHTSYLTNLIKYGNGNESLMELNLPACALHLVQDYVKKTDIAPEVTSYSPTRQTKNYKTYQAKELVDNYTSGELTVKQVAATIGIDKLTLEREFKLIFKITIGEYI
jgi:hypothetical protein